MEIYLELIKEYDLVMFVVILQLRVQIPRIFLQHVKIR